MEQKSMESLVIPLNLGSLITGEKRYNSRSWGIAFRNASKIDEIESENAKIIIYLPEEASNINTLFFEEFLQNIVTRLGETEFYKKIEFQHEGGYYIKPYVKSAVNRILQLESEYV